MSETTVTEYAARYEETIKDRLKRDDIYESVLAMFDVKQLEIKRLREALSYYADESNWHVKYGDTYILVDGGAKARAALGEGK